MATITLNSKQNYNDGSTTRYWRTIECEPQTVDLKTWSTNHPLFVIKGTVIESHDQKEIGTQREIHIQTYSFWLTTEIAKGKYTINN